MQDRVDGQYSENVKEYRKIMMSFVSLNWSKIYLGVFKLKKHENKIN